MDDDTVIIGHTLAISLDDGELIYALECHVKTDPNRPCVADTDDWFDGICNYAEWLDNVGIENMHHGTVGLGVVPVEVHFVDDYPRMRIDGWSE